MYWFIFRTNWVVGRELPELAEIIPVPSASPSHGYLGRFAILLHSTFGRLYQVTPSPVLSALNSYPRSQDPS